MKTRKSVWMEQSFGPLPLDEEMHKEDGQNPG